MVTEKKQQSETPISTSRGKSHDEKLNACLLTGLPALLGEAHELALEHARWGLPAKCTVVRRSVIGG